MTLEDGALHPEPGAAHHGEALVADPGPVQHEDGALHPDPGPAHHGEALHPDPVVLVLELLVVLVLDLEMLSGKKEVLSLIAIKNLILLDKNQILQFALKLGKHHAVVIWNKSKCVLAVPFWGRLYTTARSGRLEERRHASLGFFKTKSHYKSLS